MKKLKSIILLSLVFTVSLVFIGCSKDDDRISLDPGKEPGDEPETVIPKDSLKGAVLNDYIPGTTTYMFSDGIAINLTEDSIFGYRIAVDSLDVNRKEWVSSEKGFVIYCDSMLTPIVAVDMDNAYHFIEKSDEIYHVTRTDLDGNIPEEIANVSVKKEPSTSAMQRQSRASTTEENAILKRVSTALDIYDLVSLKRLGQKKYYKQDYITKKTQEELLSKRLSAFIDRLDNPYLNIIEDILSIAEGPMGILNFIVSFPEDYRAMVEDMVKRAIGDCTPYIQSVKRISETSANVNIKFTNVVHNTGYSPHYKVFYWYEQAGGVRASRNHTDIRQLSENGEVNIKVDNLRGGKIGFQVCVFPDTYYEHELLQQIYCFWSNIEYLELDPLKIVSISQKDAVYANGTVKAKIEVQIDFLSDLDRIDALNSEDYGVLMTQDNVQTKYSLKKGGKETVEIEVSLPGNDFMPFYGLFEASYIGKVSFCAYQSNLLGEYKSETEVPELTYDKKPALTTGLSGSVTESSAIVTCEYRYTAFWSEKIGVEFNDGAGNRHEMVQDVTEDDTYSFQLTGLQPETTYTYRAFAIIDGKHFYADNSKSFVTSKGDEEVPETSTEYLGENFTMKLSSIRKIPQMTNTYRICFYISDLDLKKDAMPYLECTCAPEGYTHYAQTKTASFKENGEINIVFENLYAGTNILSFGVLIKDPANNIIRQDIGTKKFHVNYRRLKDVSVAYMGDEIANINSSIEWRANYKVTYVFENNPLTATSITDYNGNLSISGLTHYSSSKESTATDTETYNIGIPDDQYDIDWNNYQAKLKNEKVVFSYYEPDLYGYIYGQDDIEEKSTTFEYNQFPFIEITGLNTQYSTNGKLIDWGTGGFMGSGGGGGNIYWNCTGRLFLRFATFQCEHDLPAGTIDREETIIAGLRDEKRPIQKTKLSMLFYQNKLYDNNLSLKATFPNGKSIRSSNAIKIKSYGNYIGWSILP